MLFFCAPFPFDLRVSIPPPPLSSLEPKNNDFFFPLSETAHLRFEQKVSRLAGTNISIQKLHTRQRCLTLALPSAAAATSATPATLGAASPAKSAASATPLLAFPTNTAAATASLVSSALLLWAAASAARSPTSTSSRRAASSLASAAPSAALALSA